MDLKNLNSQTQSAFGVVGFLMFVTPFDICKQPFNLGDDRRKVDMPKTNSTRPLSHEIYSLDQIMSNIRTLSNISKLTIGWNGYEAEPISARSIEISSRIIAKLDRQPKIYPTGRASIQFEYNHRGNYLEFEIFDNSISFLQEKGEVETGGLITEEEINDQVNEFYS